MVTFGESYLALKKNIWQNLYIFVVFKGYVNLRDINKFEILVDSPLPNGIYKIDVLILPRLDIYIIASNLDILLLSL